MCLTASVNAANFINIDKVVTETISVDRLEKKYISTTINVPKEVVLGENDIISGVLTDEDGNPADDVKLSLVIKSNSIDGNSITDTHLVKTDSKGQWSFVYSKSTSLVTLGENNITISLKAKDGHPKYKNFESKKATTFVKDRITSTIFIYPLNKDKSGKEFANLKQSVYISGNLTNFTNNVRTIRPDWLDLYMNNNLVGEPNFSKGRNEWRVGPSIVFTQSKGNHKIEVALKSNNYPDEYMDFSKNKYYMDFRVSTTLEVREIEPN